MSHIIFGEHDEKTVRQMERAMSVGSAHRGVLCADGHLGYNHPIGGVIGYTDHISISGVGFDIACGNMAVRLDTPFSDIEGNVATILQDITKVVSFGVGRKNNVDIDHDLFYSDLWRDSDVVDLRDLARSQLGTVGSGNHYVDLFEEESSGKTWIGVHFGSRGLGHKITTKYLEYVGAKDTMEGDPALVEAVSDLGRAYMAGLELGGLYAYAGREWVVDQVRSIIGGEVTFSVHNHHNFCWRETHDETELYVVRKGATPAFSGQYGFVGGSMADNAVILRGTESELSRSSMYSTVHGAGRVMSRMAARGKYAKDGTVKQVPRVDRQEWQQWLRDKGVTLIGADLDEAPQAYRRLDEVLAYHEGTVSIEHILSPRGVIMAGSNEFDPYKD